MYKFPFEAVLTHRRYLEDLLKKDLSILKKELAKANERLYELKNLNSRVDSDIKEKLETGAIASEVLYNVEYIENLLMDIEYQKKLVDQIALSVQSKRNELIQRMISRRTIEKLEDKGRRVYQLSLGRKEEAFTNEMASVRFTRKN
ncbi:hypothetical protein PITCH_A1500012 [uncultured Desulfobacterium sp.]|uniref:Flagellar FliJ protein n=1 Tax=uncultured Desulfobacterium sp. TaxID=201089 RepID=A0A445MTA5_9BACT|nr:hypothetical protein PITCH_A1500012 [uncultured Desulfobacterium sp.]